jgi:hypothetical protein
LPRSPSKAQMFIWGSPRWSQSNATASNGSWVSAVHKLVFGSNAPHGIPLFAIRGFQMVNLPQTEKEAILGGTLAHLYRLAGEDSVKIFDCEAYLPNSGNPYLCGDSFEAANLIHMLDDVDTEAVLTIPAPEAIRRLGLSDAQERLIFRTNFQRIYGLE